MTTPSGHAETRSAIEALLEHHRNEFFNKKRLSIEVREIEFESAERATVHAYYLLDGYSAMGFGSAPPGNMDLEIKRTPTNQWRIFQAVIGD